MGVESEEIQQIGTWVNVFCCHWNQHVKDQCLITTKNQQRFFLAQVWVFTNDWTVCIKLAIISSSFRLQFLAWDRSPRNLPNSFPLCIRVLRFGGNCAILHQSKHDHSDPIFLYMCLSVLQYHFPFFISLFSLGRLRGQAVQNGPQGSFLLWDMPNYKSYITDDVNGRDSTLFLSVEIFQLVINWMILHLLDIWSILSLVFV